MAFFVAETFKKLSSLQMKICHSTNKTVIFLRKTRKYTYDFPRDWNCLVFNAKCSPSFGKRIKSSQQKITVKK